MAWRETNGAESAFSLGAKRKRVFWRTRNEGLFLARSKMLHELNLMKRGREISSAPSYGTVYGWMEAR